jgi:hypothetical protein
MSNTPKTEQLSIRVDSDIRAKANNCGVSQWQDMLRELGVTGA